jgi:hypothetical protein
MSLTARSVNDQHGNFAAQDLARIEEQFSKGVANGDNS